MNSFEMILGIEASNIRAGGGLTHLTEILNNIEYNEIGFDKVVIWASSSTLKSLPKKECLVAFTFDDGFEECYTTIAPLLEKYNCNAAFFINANYIGSDENYQQSFNTRINTFTKKPMSWEQVIDLHRRGHVIGAHTLDHVNMAELTEKELVFQLAENKKILESKINYNCEYFAWTYGKLQHFPEEALLQTLKYHRYIFSGTNYKHYFSLNGRVINRRHIEAFWPKAQIKYFLQ
ncbi:MAG: polysaccharide deacetylase family protein [Paludibacter sp.]|nr:polysaccharide deacetylase family protein [Paludibacter sp.]